jgi:hypothetical protein
MTEPHASADGPSDRDRSDTPPVQDADAAEDALLNPYPEPTDDTPTVITKKPAAPVSADEALAGVLRGRKLAHYELLEPIGVGGMAAVIRARDPQLDRTVAVKILPPEMAADTDNVQRFHQEARAAARLDHENIARAFFCGEDQGLHFIAFEFVEGENLRTLLERRGRLPAAEAVGYTLQIATGLAHAAARGVVHRDIKPSNILITPAGKAKLVDMGLARSLHHDTGLTQSGVTLGTFDYISPEQALEPREADVRSDIYSLGCTLYHMLAGVPPVPDGTPAKKLHHHQHVPPVDPRQLNGDIPDDVAAVLGRMMAKDPKDRYQQPEQVVEHLLLLARKLGGAPDGRAAGANPLPGPPRARPVVLGLAAVAALVALVLVLGPTSPWPSGKPGSNLKREPAIAKREPEPVGHEPGPVTREDERPTAPEPLKPSGPAMRTIQTAADLADALEEPHDRAMVLRLKDDLTLTPNEVFELAGRDVTIEPDGPGLRTLRLIYDGSPEPEPLALFNVKSGKVRLNRLRLEVDAAAAADLAMTAVWHQGGLLEVRGCEFVQRRPPEGAGSGSLSSVTVGSPPGIDGPPTTVSLDECYFAGGQRALTVAGGARVNLTNCAFAPHAAAFHVPGEGAGDAAVLTLANCSVLVADGGAVVRLADGPACSLRADHCVISCPDAGPDVRATLAEETGNRAAWFRYNGGRNAFHNLWAYWARAGSPGLAVTRWDDFRQESYVERDDRSEVLTASPWLSANVQQALSNSPRLAFQVREDRPELRQRESQLRPLGVERCSWGQTYPTGLRRLPDKVTPPETVARKEKTVDPEWRGESGQGVYKTLALAVGDAEPGDVILLRFTGARRVEPVRLEKATADLTIKAADGYRPVLTLGDTTEPDAALFRVHDGQLRLEGLTFHLPPPRDEFKAQSVMAMMGNGQCTFKDCAATLEEGDRTPMTFVTVADPSAVMRMGPPPAQTQVPRVRLDGCFVRGAGDLVTVRPSRPFDLRVDDSLVALKGSLVVVDGGSREPADRPSTVSFKKLTAYLTDHLLWLRGQPGEGRTGRLVPTRVSSAQHCLFHSAAGRSLVHLEGVERLDNDDQMRRLFEWTDGQHNVYSSFPQLIDQQPREPDMMMGMVPYDRDRWAGFAAEYDGRHDKARFAAAPAEDLLARVLPADLKVRTESDMTGYGADVDRLPKPADVGPQG